MVYVGKVTAICKQTIPGRRPTPRTPFPPCQSSQTPTPWGQQGSAGTILVSVPRSVERSLSCSRHRKLPPLNLATTYWSSHPSRCVAMSALHASENLTSRWRSPVSSPATEITSGRLPHRSRIHGAVSGPQPFLRLSGVWRDPTRNDTRRDKCSSVPS